MRGSIGFFACPELRPKKRGEARGRRSYAFSARSRSRPSRSRRAAESESGSLEHASASGSDADFAEAVSASGVDGEHRGDASGRCCPLCYLRLQGNADGLHEIINHLIGDHDIHVKRVIPLLAAAGW